MPRPLQSNMGRARAPVNRSTALTPFDVCHFRLFAIVADVFLAPFPGKTGYFLGATTVIGDAPVWPYDCAVKAYPREAVMLKVFKPLIAGVMFACWIAPAPVFGNSPTEQIQETIQQVL